ncbi:type VII secretion protein EssC [Vallitalea longa]|uniref:Type VII secretion protein EssC n=1 Tax=Vallitalea longa TaxID=2936439 RepID=A0A9W6DEN3_9FIRM|nr:type VII secretion protein EssC [Vallitalea longa]GKX28623.1 type VII secretion protein EssC [Vallitalea longa]
MKEMVLYVYYNETVREYVLSNEIQLCNMMLSEVLPVVLFNGEWFLAPNEYTVVSKKKIDVGDKINVSFTDSEEIATIYVDMETNCELSFKKYSIEEEKQIQIGNSDNNSIYYDGFDMKENHAVISLEKGRATISVKKDKCLCVNGKMVSSTVLNYGDFIHIMGLKMFYLGRSLAINSSIYLKNCDLSPYIPIKPRENEPVKNKKRTKKEDMYFQRSPRIIKKLEEGVINIDSPPAPPDEKEQPLILSIGPALTMGMAMMVSLLFTIYSSRNNPFMVIPGIAMTGSMLLGAVLWPVLNKRYRKRMKKKEEKKRIKRYRQYMQNEYSRLEEKIAYNKKVLLVTYPEPTILINRAMNRDRRLWERMPSNRDFLDIRLGIGTMPSLINIQKPKEGFTMNDDNLMGELKDIGKNFDGVSNMPITFSMMKSNMLGIIGRREITVDTAMASIVHISSLHSYDEVKIVCVYNQKESEKWEWVKQLPHVWAPEKALRFVASSRDEVRDVFLCLKELLSDRDESQDKDKVMHLPHFLVYIADPELVEDELVMKYLTNPNKQLGVSTIFIYEKLNLLPKECKAFVQCDETESSLYNRDKPESGLIRFTPDSVIGKDLDSYSRALAGIKIKEIASSASLTSMLTFLEMYKIGRIEKLSIKSRWKNNLSYRTLEAPLGVKAGGSQFLLNIHEKHHGPHGLIAGMTGSGKSEFIQSYILSMAVNYHPHDVAFILIDYKGGGMANCFIGLPHISGTITNLGGNQIRRSLVSLQSELKRRQRIFAEHGVNHIDKYQQMYKEGKANEPLPHLVIISDEFAELKAGQPEFMQELVSAARIGRSLGVHLILATQKPSGVVDDQIWSNTRFRICLKVLDKSDSNEMLKRPEAANIREPGRCYVQVGNNEIFELVQSGWSGGAYIPTDKIENDADNQISLIDGCGRAIQTVSCKPKAVKSSTTQLTAVVDYISELADEEGIEPLKLWLDPLEEEVFIQDVEDRDIGWTGEEWQEVDHWLYPSIGLIDDPANQRQLPLKLDIGNMGHILLVGAPGTGKTTFLQTMIYSLVTSYSPDLVNLYLLDFGGRTMGYYQYLPHTGGVIFSEESDKLDKLFKLLKKELDSRKKKFSEYGVGTLKAYMEASKKKIPAMIVIIDNYEAFNELYPDYEYIITTFSREGGNYGIDMVITASNTNSVKFKIAQSIKLMVALQLNDKYDYVNLVGQTGGLVPEQVKGRGLCKMEIPLEFQTALACKSVNEAERVQKLRDLFKVMNEKWKGNKAKPIPFVPEKLDVDLLLDQMDSKELIENNMLPIGYDVDEAEIVAIDFTGICSYTILGYEMTGKTNLLKVMLRIIASNMDWKVYVVENGKSLQKMSSKYQVDGYVNSVEAFDSFIEGLVEEMKIRLKDLKQFREEDNEEIKEYEYMKKYQRIFVLIEDYDNFLEMISKNAKSLLENITKNGVGLEVCFVFTADTSTLLMHRSTPLYGNVFKGMNGILLGGKFDSQNVYDVQMDYRKRSVSLNPGLGYLINRSNYVTIKTPQL